MLLNPLKKNVINQLVAAEEGRELHDAVEPYFRAFTGEFSADMPFTFYFEAVNRPVLFVHDATPIDRRSSHASFIAQCDRIRANILPITTLIQELADTGYLRVRPLEFRDRPTLPPDYANQWRKYKQFYSDVMDALSFVCFSELRPAQKLYDVWVTFHAEVLAG
ncbi:hypothetical protein FACS1894141_5440 [Spirochaetia bacterium]|nr:hypothetical protein FACS1894141_5440 [Spirochaetia bacterium]